jgi:phage-related protein
MAEKPLAWVGSSLGDVRGFPEDARRQIGHELYQVQQSLLPSNWRPMPSVGTGVIEIRTHGEHEHRVFYVAKYEEAVYVLHAFAKKSQKTPKRELDLGRRRYSELMKWRAAQRKE